MVNTKAFVTQVSRYTAIAITPLMLMKNRLYKVLLYSVFINLPQAFKVIIEYRTCHLL